MSNPDPVQFGDRETQGGENRYRFASTRPKGSHDSSKVPLRQSLQDETRDAVWRHSEVLKSYQVPPRRSTECLDLGVNAFALRPLPEDLDRRRRRPVAPKPHLTARADAKPAHESKAAE